MSGDHFQDQKALAVGIGRLISAYFGPRFCVGCALAALMTCINRIVEIAIQQGHDEVLQTAAQGLSRIEQAARSKQPISEKDAVVFGLPTRHH
jgi:hypothetical protein